MGERDHPMIEMTELVRSDRPVITAYRPDGFTVGDQPIRGTLLITPEGYVALAAERLDELGEDALEPIFAAEPDIDILVIGGGARLAWPPARLADPLRGAGIVVEPMDSAAAARTFNVLVLEERRVAALLFPVGAGAAP